MLHPFFAALHPLVFAHRGGAALAPENTIAAFDNGLALGADGIELDVRLSRDGVPVVHHDSTLERTTGIRRAVASCTADELAALHVPALSAVLKRYPRTRIIIEMKGNSLPIAHAVVRDIQAAGALDRVSVGSFGLKAIRAVRRLLPGVATSAAKTEVRLALYRSWLRLPVTRTGYQGYQVPECAGRTRVVSPRFVADAHRIGLGVQVWAVDREDDARRLIEWAVDALITDRPDLIVPVARSAAAQPASIAP